MSVTKKNSIRFDTIASDCYTCVLNQAASAARLAEISEEKIERVIAVAKAGLEEAKSKPLLVQHIVRRVADAIILEQGESEDFDPYAKTKEKSNNLSLLYAKKYERSIDRSESPIEQGLQVAAAGNIIDFGAKNHGSMDIEKELQLLGDIRFDRYDIKAFKSTLNNASALLYICDNSGEIVFDMLFIKTLLRKYPKLNIVAALRDKPIINDATLADAKAIGLDHIVKTISSGSVYPGTILPETTDEFKKLFASADLILAKGQGNFETLLPIADKRLFFLLRIKCEYMATISNVKKDNLVLMQGGKEKA